MKFGWPLTFLLSVCALGCSGLIVEPFADDNSQEPLACKLEIPQAGESRIRRLTPIQYQNTVRELFADRSIAVSLQAANDLIPSAIEIEKLDAAAAKLAPRSLSLLDGIAACQTQNDACAEAFVDAFATRAFRRPLLAAERSDLLSVFARAQAKFSFEESITVLTQIILVSPQFVYLAPIGEPVDGSPGVRKLSDYELASRLSYFLWNSMPDQELLDAAENLVLTSGDGQGLAEQTERMLQSDKARAMADEFVASWLALDGGKVSFGLDEAPKDASLYPTLDADLRADMRKEVSAFMQKVVFEGGSVSDLFTDNSAYVNGPLARLYGVTDGPTGADDWQWVKLNPAERAGLLTRAAFATVYASSRVQAPIRRGTFVLREVLCYDQPPPPPNVDNRPIEGGEPDDAPMTIRDVTTRRTQAAECIGCHTDINGIGFAFENYDAMGLYRKTEIESGLPIDASGSLGRSGATDGPVANAIAMSAALGESEVVADCLAERWFKHALRRDPGLLDDCSFESIRSAVGDSTNMRDLLIAIVQSDAFQYRNTGEQ